MATLDELRQSLITPLPDEQKNLESTATTKDIIHALHSDLIRERQRGITWQVLANRLKSKGVDISAKTLARYVGEINTQQRQKLRPRSRNKPTENMQEERRRPLTLEELANREVVDQQTVDISAETING